MEEDNEKTAMDAEPEESSDTNMSRKTSTVNIDDTRFSVDGIVAEMIIEVDEEILQSPVKPLPEHVIEVSGLVSGGCKAAFIRTLGLGSISDSAETVTLEDSEEDEVLEKSDQEHVLTVEPKVQHQAESSEKKSTTSQESIPEKHGRSLRKKRKTVFSAPTKYRNQKLQPLPSITAESKFKLQEAKVVLRKLVVGINTGRGIKLGDIQKIADQIHHPRNAHFVRSLFRVLFDCWPPNDVDNLRYQILQFNGFSFSRTSLDFQKRKTILEKFSTSVLHKISVVLNIVGNIRRIMISNILNFLMRPCREIDLATNPKYQPYVLMKKLSTALLPYAARVVLQGSDASTVIKVEEPEITPRKKRGRPPKIVSVRSDEEAKSPVFPETLMSGRITRNSLSSQLVAMELSALKTFKTPTPQRRGFSPSSKKLPLKKRKLIPVSPAPSQKPIKLEPLSPGPESHPNLTEKSIGKLDVNDGTETTQKTTPNDQAKLGFSNMQRRSADKRRTPSHYGEWIHGMTNKKLRLDRKVLAAANVSKGKVILSRKQPSSVMKKSLRFEAQNTITSEMSETKQKKSNNAATSEKKTEKAPTTRAPEKKQEKVTSKRNSEKEQELLPDDDDDDIPLPEPETVLQEMTPEDEETTSASEEQQTSGKQEVNKKVNTSQNARKTISKKPPSKTKGVKLSTFPVVVDAMKIITNVALQRLHVILFGTSSEPNIMKKNILDFRGFPFDDQSEEYQQKHFFLSLLASNNIAEVFEVLHIEVSNTSPTGLVDTLMQFLMAPQKELLDKQFQIEVKKAPKKERNPNAPRHRKVLMDEETYRKMEMEIAREQRARRRADLLTTNAIKTIAANSYLEPESAADKDVQLLFPTSDSSVRIKLGDSPHIQFMVVALSYFDLDVIHHLLFLHGASRARIRRSIMEFRGFAFDEESPRYKARLMILKRLGMKMVQRIAFILGLTPMNCKKNLHRLAELIMQFLISPSRMKQVPIKEFPENFILDCPKEFDKKAIFADIPEFQQVLQMEFGSGPNVCDYLVKNVSEPKLQGDITQLQNKAMVASEAIIPVAEVVTSGSVRLAEKQAGSSLKQVQKSPTSLGQMIAVRSGDDKNVSYHILQNNMTTVTPGKKLFMLQKPGGYVLQEIPKLAAKPAIQPKLQRPEVYNAQKIQQKPVVPKTPQKPGVVLQQKPKAVVHNTLQRTIQKSVANILSKSAEKLEKNTEKTSQVPILKEKTGTTKETQSKSGFPIVKIASPENSSMKKSLQAINSTSSILAQAKGDVLPPKLPPGQTFLLDPAKIQQVIKNTSAHEKGQQEKNKNSEQQLLKLHDKHRLITKINLSQAIQQKSIALSLTSPTSKTTLTAIRPKVVEDKNKPTSTAAPELQLLLKKNLQRQLTPGNNSSSQEKPLAVPEKSRFILSKPLQAESVPTLKTTSPSQDKSELARETNLLSPSVLEEKSLSLTYLKQGESPAKVLTPGIHSSPSPQPPSSLPQTILISSPSLNSAQSPGFILQNPLGSAQPQTFFFLQKTTDGQSNPQTILVPAPPTLLVPMPPSSTASTASSNLLQPPTLTSAPSSLPNTFLNVPSTLSLPGLTPFPTTDQNKTSADQEKKIMLKRTSPLKISSAVSNKVDPQATIISCQLVNMENSTTTSKSLTSVSSINAANKSPCPESSKDHKEMAIQECESRQDVDSIEEDDDLTIVHNQPSDIVLYDKILDMIQGADLSELTFKNIIDKLASQFPGLDVTARRSFIKNSVKNIVCGDSES